MTAQKKTQRLLELLLVAPAELCEASPSAGEAMIFYRSSDGQPGVRVRILGMSSPICAERFVQEQGGGRWISVAEFPSLSPAWNDLRGLRLRLQEARAAALVAANDEYLGSAISCLEYAVTAQAKKD